MSILGLDIGTSGCKASIVDIDGRLLAASSRGYSLATGPGFELDPLQVWDAVCNAIRQVAADCPAEDPVQVVSASSLGESVVAVNSKGEPVGNSMIYTDSRGAVETDELENRLGFDKIVNITGLAPGSMYSIGKIMWIRKNLYEQYGAAWKFFSFADYILFRLGAHPHTDYSLAARTMLFDIHKKSWSAEMAEAAGIDLAKFAQPVASGTPVGVISREAARMLGLPDDVQLVAGGHDQPCAALGAGIIGSGGAVDSVGTTECITPSFSSPKRLVDMARQNFACALHVLPDRYVTYAFNLTAGSLIKWYHRQFGRLLVAGGGNAPAYDEMLKVCRGEPSSLLVLPHFAGSGTPYLDSACVGACTGLTLSTTPQDILKGIIEGMALEMYHNMLLLTHLGIGIDWLHAVGGVARSADFLQLKADVMGIPVRSLAVSEAGTMGTAILAGVAAGIYPSTADAVKALVRVERQFDPNMQRHKFYMEKYKAYSRMYEAVKHIYAEPPNDSIRNRGYEI